MDSFYYLGALKLDGTGNNILSDSNLDDYIERGQYVVLTASIAHTIENIPEEVAGQLIVSYLTNNTKNNGTKLQIYLTVGGSSGDTVNNTRIYIRYKNNLGWSSWDKITYQSNIEQFESALLLNATNKSGISTGSDLNNYITAGQWKIGSTAIGKSLINKPKDFKSTGLLTVMNTHNTNHVYQIIVSNSGTNIWARHIMIDSGDGTPLYNSWESLITPENGSYSWQKSGFLIHDPNEESEDMINIVADLLNITITQTDNWMDADNIGHRIISAADIYSMWDELQSQYPEYIDEGEAIGYSLDTDGETHYGTIKAYYIHPRKTYTTYGGSTVNIDYYLDIPTIYITAGTHGNESSPTWTLFEIFRRAFLTGTIYSSFLKGMQFRIIPVLDIWSYDHWKRYLAAAYDENGDPKPEALDPSDPSGNTIKDDYDANRQCICLDMTNPTYATLDLRPFASEAAALTNYLNTNNFGSVSGDCYIDLHNCSYSLGYITTDNPVIGNMYNVMIDDLNKDWKVNTTYANGDPVDYYSSSTSSHTQLRGKILAHPSVEASYGWFFEKAYASYSSNILEVQQADGIGVTGGAGNKFAFAKTFDITYRWFKTLINKIKVNNESVSM